MNSLSRLRAQLLSQRAPRAKGQWQAIKMCFDEDAGEFLNVGVMFRHNSSVEVRMLDNFDRLKCLFGNRLDTSSVSRTLIDIEDTIHHHLGDFPSLEINSLVHLSAPLFAAGDSPEAVIDEFFSDIVTLGMPTGRPARNFRYFSSQKALNNVLDVMRQKMPLDADKIILSEPYLLKLRGSKNRLSVNVPLLGDNAAGSVVSVWYKDHVVVENNLLKAASDLHLISSNIDTIEHKAVSILMPGKDCGMGKKEFDKHYTTTQKQIDRMQHAGIEVISAHSTDELANESIAWWKEKIPA